MPQAEFRQVEKFPEPSRIQLVVSDFHLGTGRFFSDGRLNTLEDFLYDEEFADFLEHHSSGEFMGREVELVLNGDILNLIQIDFQGVHTHLITERATCHAVERIIAGHRAFFEALKRFASHPRRSISYIVGNHDAAMLWPGPRRIFERAVGAPVRFHDVSLRRGGVHIEHGQQHEEICRMNMSRPFVTRGLPEPVLNLPWGSLFVAVWLTRIKLERPHVDKVKPFSHFLRWVLLHDTAWAVGTILRMLKFFWDTVAFRPRYRIVEGVRATWGMFRQVSVYPCFDRIAAEILEAEPSLTAVIFGHTHILKHRRFRGGTEYFNEGSWNEATNLELAEFGTQVKLTYAFVEHPPGGGRAKIRLKRWMGRWKPELDLPA